jgi:hypothetical protein
MDESFDRPPPVSAFDAFGAGALCVVAGIAQALAFFGSGPWTRQDTAALAAALATGGRGTVVLRRLYRRQAPGRLDSATEQPPAIAEGARESTSRPAP